MGESARWVCSTCKTICYRGGTPIFKGIPESPTIEELKSLKTAFCSLMSRIRLVTDDEDRYVYFMDDLITWLSVHEGHNIHIGSDYSTDMWDLEDYRVEAIDGTTHKLTILEEAEEARSKTYSNAISRVSKLIDEYADNKDNMSSEAIAKEILDKYSLIP